MKFCAKVVKAERIAKFIYNTETHPILFKYAFFDEIDTL